MAIPPVQAFEVPILRRIADGAEYRLKDLRDGIADELELSVDDRTQTLTGSHQLKYVNSISWAGIHLAEHGLADRPAPGVIRITEAGKKAIEHLGAPVPLGIAESPDERLDRAYSEIRSAVANDLLARLKTLPPDTFEHVVREVMEATFQGEGEVTGRSGDGGIDGFVRCDKLGLERIHFQAKRWDATVGRPEVQGFAGSLDGVKGRKGVFVTTSAFAQTAVDYVKHLDKRIELVDGKRFVELMIDHKVGVLEERTLTVLRIDTSYFDE